jgi:hypothetical protein
MNSSKVISWFILCLLAVGCGEGDGGKNAGGKLFTFLQPEKTGVHFVNKIVESTKRHYSNFNPLYDGGGVAIGDVNNDGLPDLYFTGNEVPNKLYLNKGDLKFEDVTNKAGVAGGGGWHNGVAMVDINNDGLLDIYVCRGGWIKDPNQRKNLLFINKGNLKFEEQAVRFGLADAGYSFQAAFFDYDNDGDLDAYVINHPDKSNLQIAEYIDGRANGSKFCKDRLYQNQGNNTFVDVTEQAGMGGTYGFGLGVAIADLDNNGFQDVYVSNDYTEPDYFFLNNGNGTLTESVKERMPHIPVFSMGIDISDIDNDGLEDIFITEMLPDDYKRSKTNMASMNPQLFEEMVAKGFHHCYMHNVLQLNRGNGYFSDVAQLAGMSKTDWSWACFITDFDNDGLRDVFVANGYRRDLYDKDAQQNILKYVAQKGKGDRDINELMNIFPSEKLENYIFKNDGGLHFTKMTKEWGLDQPSFSNGASIADLDNDGDLDLVVNNLNQEAFVYRNNASKTGNNYLRITLDGPAGNRQGLGTKVHLKVGDKQLVEQFKTNRGYLGTVEPVLHFGLGTATKVDEVRIEWFDGKVNILNNVAAKTELTINYKDAAQPPAGVDEPAPTPVFNELTASAFDKPFVHTENAFDDYKKQILLPHRMSRLGPFITVADVNGDGLEDFYVGGAANQAGQLFLQNNQEKFQAKEVKAFTDDRGYEDMGALFFDADGDGDPDLYVVSGGTEFPEGSTFYQDRLYLNDGKSGFTKSNALPVITASGSCVAAADIDGDKDLDLFVGGRSIPDRYPYPPSSFILLNEGGTFKDATPAIAPQLAQIGMVTTASWSDFDNNGTPDLVLAGEWMPVKFFKNEGGKLQDVSSTYLPEESTGWWNRIVAYDIDRDGDLDYIAGNLGLNYKFKADKEKPFHIYCDDFDKNGSFDVVLAKHYGDQQVPIRGRECSSQQMPFIAQKFPTYHAFADAKLNDIYGDQLKSALHYEARWFASSLLINDKGTFRIEKLPLHAQFSTVQGILAGDFDSDGNVDLLLGGNMFHSEVETTRADASVGLLLKQEANRSFSTMGVERSGFFIPYDVKDMQLIHLGKNNKKAVLVGSNNDKLRLFVENSSVPVQ